MIDKLKIVALFFICFFFLYSCDEGYVADTSSGQLLCFYDADDTCNCNDNGALDGTCDEFGNCRCKVSTKYIL